MIELTSAIVLLVSSLYGSANTAVAQSMADSINTQSQEPITNPVTLESYVREYFAETPILAEIARCESGFRQFSSSGQAIRGKANEFDVGLMQINELYHSKKAISLGFDLNTVNGNLDYAKYLYGKEGSTPWNASAKCWKAK